VCSIEGLSLELAFEGNLGITLIVCGTLLEGGADLLY
jgi:hypothetical protein